MARASWGESAGSAAPKEADANKSEAKAVEKESILKDDEGCRDCRDCNDCSS